MVAHLSTRVDQAVNWLKWPVAAAAVCWLPGALKASAALVARMAGEPLPSLPLLGGAVAYALLWFQLFRHRVFGSFLPTFEHELTHALFAWATFHRVTGLRATWRRGGHITYRGPGNWLITIAPYFFPTVSVLLLVLSLLLPHALLSPLGALMGVTIGYHLTSTYRETHWGQTDLQQVGWLFAFLFLPAANVVSYGLLISFCHGGVAAMREFLLTTVLWW